MKVMARHDHGSQCAVAHWETTPSGLMEGETQERGNPKGPLPGHFLGGPFWLQTGMSVFLSSLEEVSPRCGVGGQLSGIF